MARGGHHRTDGGGTRRCIVTGDSGPRNGLIRFVLDPRGALTLDLAEKLPGRGYWVAASGKALAEAGRRNVFSRMADRAVIVPDDLPGQAAAALKRRLGELLSLSRKAGQAVAGFEKCRAMLLSGEAALLFQALDGSPREKSRLAAPNGPETRVEWLDSAELGLAFGRDRVIHAALKAGGITDRVSYEVSRLSGALAF